MYKNGHRGLSLFLSAPIVAILLLLDLPVLGIFFCVSVFILASLPDIDLKISSIKHRGITHTVWFALFSGIVYAILVSGIVSITGSKNVLLQQFSVSYIYLVVFVFGTGFSGVLFHLLGDIITPMGVNMFSRQTNDAVSFNLLLAKNEVANDSAFALGVIGLVFTGILTQYPHLLYFTNLPTISLYIGGYTLLFLFWIGMSTTTVGKGLYRIVRTIYDYITS
jgi:inner membrane protein